MMIHRLIGLEMERVHKRGNVSIQRPFRRLYRCFQKDMSLSTETHASSEIPSSTDPSFSVEDLLRVPLHVVDIPEVIPTANPGASDLDVLSQTELRILRRELRQKLQQEAVRYRELTAQRTRLVNSIETLRDRIASLS
jgi:hypothetical protein